MPTSTSSVRLRADLFGQEGYTRIPLPASWEMVLDGARHLRWGFEDMADFDDDYFPEMWRFITYWVEPC